ncbi:MAG TPA: DegT/DnrJ/EryC1/StrS aminotransferase family protein [Fimbriimonadaceae bacterium]
MSFPSWPHFESDEIEAAQRVLESGKVNYWTGDEGQNFEKEFADYVGIKKAIACANGSLALEMAVKALNLDKGDEMIVTPRSFIASTSAVVLMGLKPVFADVDRDSGNITARTIEKALTPKTRAILPVHLGGWPCEMSSIMELAASKGLKVIEDCAQAHGAKIDGRSVGSFGHINAWSFCQDKIITTGGEGGMVTTDDEELWNRAWSYKDHGKSYDAVFNREHKPGFRWQHESFGTNMRLTEPQSAIGRVQLCKLENWVERRRRNADILVSRLKSLGGLRFPRPRAGVDGAYYRLYGYLEPGALKTGVTREDLIAAVNEQGVPVFSGTCGEIYLEKAFESTGFAPAKRLPIAQELGETSLAFLTHPTLTEEHMQKMADIFESAFIQLKR